MKVNPDDLLDSHEVAGLLELTNHRSVSAYRSHYSDFPQPFIDKGRGRTLLWHRKDIEAWRAKHPGRER